MVGTNDIIGNKLVAFAIILGVLSLLSGISFFTDASAGLDDAVTTGVSLFGLVVVLWLFGREGPLKS